MEAGRPTDDLQRQVLQNTLHEITTRQEDATDCCVICLESITEVCEAIPCEHRNFDYLCLLSWLEQSPKCPLCKAVISQVRHALDEPVAKTYTVPRPVPKAQNQQPETRNYAPAYIRRHHLTPRRRPYPRRSRYETSTLNPSDEIARRRDVYSHNRYSKHVGSNRLSRYRELTPAAFCADTELVSRARMWIRRELHVFSFLAPDANDTESQPGDRRRANNAEFLLEYIVAVLKSVDIMGSAGQAEDMISDFLGRDNTRLFLHELRAWLRSPYTKLSDWDRAVQYDVSTISPRNETRDDSMGGASQAKAEQGRNCDSHRRQGDFYRPGGRSQRARVLIYNDHDISSHLISSLAAFKMPTISITVISDPVCPWCYIGALRLSRAMRLYHKTVSSTDTILTKWHAYQLDPNATAQSLASKMASRWGTDKVPSVKARLAGFAKREGFEFNFDSTIGNTRDAHRLEKLARQYGLEREVAMEIMRMYFEDGGDIASKEDLVDAAERAGVGRRRAREWLEGDYGGDEVDAEVQEMQRMNVTGVPRYIINDKFVVDGADDVAEFLQHLVMAREEALTEPADL
ncbi:hypothetical protein F66182_5370 [Fusarium sp. NRRL 66182]|nr:hypothetical protein F66182_5370 [Fusarium sp. NRRL 66182]